MKAPCGLLRIVGVSERSASRGGHVVPYRIVVRGEVGPPFGEPLRGAVVESVAAESTLLIDIVDQSHLQSVLTALADRGIEIVSLDAVTRGHPR